MVEPDNIVLERHIRGAVDVPRHDRREVKQRICSHEREVAHVHVKLAELPERVDRVSERPERVERRLDLTEA
ncbi:hypothetical protein [Bradyrhizobium sp.]|uniref:hypothetical protein n=1 Tax=Bradyrhizobium sp. TaxID=376 RepID=UPI003C63286F